METSFKAKRPADLFQFLGSVVEFLLCRLDLAPGDLHDFGVHRLNALFHRIGG